MRPRLTRNQTDAVITGVCGGLGEYFSIDPIFPRLIFVLVTFLNGLGIPVYLILWLVMPKKHAADGYPQIAHQHDSTQIYWGIPKESNQHQTEQSDMNVIVSRPAVQQPHIASQAEFRQGMPQPSAYQFDPQTGKPIRQQQIPSTGPTIKLGKEEKLPAAQPLPLSSPAVQQSQPQGSSWRRLGTILVILGGIMFINKLGLDMGYIIAILMIVVGFKLTKRGS